MATITPIPGLKSKMLQIVAAINVNYSSDWDDYQTLTIIWLCKEGNRCHNYRDKLAISLITARLITADELFWREVGYLVFPILSQFWVLRV
jgi:hypothetical protein